MRRRGTVNFKMPQNQARVNIYSKKHKNKSLQHSSPSLTVNREIKKKNLKQPSHNLSLDRHSPTTGHNILKTHLLCMRPRNSKPRFRAGFRNGDLRPSDTLPASGQAARPEDPLDGRRDPAQAGRPRAQRSHSAQGGQASLHRQHVSIARTCARTLH